nr:MAG TPA: hypothetical protein [Bacteriophage sp.]DAR41992.1 MAG TPA: hypothetical protein [Bacteriophage sp.]
MRQSGINNNITRVRLPCSVQLNKNINLVII